MSASLSFDGMTKRYGAALVLDDVSVSLKPGRIHALMGENGAGKSTFIKLIAGVEPADAMTVTKDGETLQIASAADAWAAGFRFIHQELNIIPQLSVAENILLSHPCPTRLGLFVNWRDMKRRAQAALARLGVDHIDPRTHAGDLSTGDKMLVKLASALVTGRGEAEPCLYVLDEPTAALQDSEVEKLFTVLDGLRAEGAAILYVSHRIAEITALCDDVSVLRNGVLISSTSMRQTDAFGIVKDMTGKSMATDIPKSAAPADQEIVARFAGVSAKSLSDLEFELRRGEVIGIAGLAGAGQTDLLRLFLGEGRITTGTAQLAEDDLPQNPVEAWQNGIAYVPQERRSEGLMMRMGVRTNMLLPHLAGLFAKLRAEKAQSRVLADRVRLKSEGPEQPVWQLSGGNQQKIVFARAMGGDPKLLLLDEPTRGVDIGARAEIYGLIRDLVDEGCSIMLASSDLPELIGLSDRILILHEGRQTELTGTKGLTPETLLNKIYQHQESAA